MRTLLFISLFISVKSCGKITKNVLSGYKSYDYLVKRNKVSKINSHYNYKKKDIIFLNKKLRERLNGDNLNITIQEIEIASAIEQKFIKYLNISKRKSFLNINSIDLILTRLDKDKDNTFAKEEIEYLKLSKLLKLKRLKDKK